MNFLKINAGESQIVTLTDNEVKEEKNQWGGWTYNHIVNFFSKILYFFTSSSKSKSLKTKLCATKSLITKSDLSLRFFKSSTLLNLI